MWTYGENLGGNAVVWERYEAIATSGESLIVGSLRFSSSNGAWQLAIPVSAFESYPTDTFQPSFETSEGKMYKWNLHASYWFSTHTYKDKRAGK